MSIDRLWDPLYGRVELSGFAARLLALPEVQRLRYIRMCNINSLLVTGASEISRFEHTVGVLRLTQEWLDAHSLDSQGGRNLLAAAILHDVQTGPFGHSFQYVLEDSKSTGGEFLHQDLDDGRQKNFYMRVDTAAQFGGKPFGAPQLLGPNWTDVAALIDGHGTYGPLISGTMDLDNLDNVIRMAYHVGVADREDARAILRIVRCIKPGTQKGKLRISPDVTKDILRWQRIRERLYELLLLDWAEFSAKAMLTKAVEEALEKDLIGINSWSQTDDSFLSDLETRSIGECQHIAELLGRLRRGDLYWPIVLARTSVIGAYAEFSQPDRKGCLVKTIETDILRPLGIHTSVLFHVILDKGKTRRAITIEVEDANSIVLGDDSNVLLVGVFLSRSAVKSKEVISTARHRITDYLSEVGMGTLEELPDPMGDAEQPETSQLLLL